MLPLRPLPSLVDVATISGSILRHGLAFHIQRRLFHATKTRERELSPYRDEDWSLARKKDLILLSFPRRRLSLGFIRWATLRIPRFSIWLSYYGARYLVFWGSHFQEEKGVVVKSRIGRLFFRFITQPGCFEELNLMMEPWGTFRRTSGKSMLPTLGANPAISYVSYC